MTRALKFLGIFFLGAIVGAIVMAYLASRASSVFSHSLELSYSFEQQREAASAAEHGRWLEAAMAYHNIAAAETRTNLPFGVDNVNWELPFPLASLLLEQISAASDPTGKGKRAIAGLAHARYAFALEKSGQLEAANIEFGNALKYGTFSSIDGARSLAISLVKQDCSGQVISDTKIGGVSAICCL